MTKLGIQLMLLHDVRPFGVAFHQCITHTYLVQWHDLDIDTILQNVIIHFHWMFTIQTKKFITISRFKRTNEFCNQHDNVITFHTLLMKLQHMFPHTFLHEGHGRFICGKGNNSIRNRQTICQHFHVFSIFSFRHACIRKNLGDNRLVTKSTNNLLTSVDWNMLEYLETNLSIHDIFLGHPRCICQVFLSFVIHVNQ